MAQARIAGLVGAPTSVGLHPNRKDRVVAFRPKAKFTLPSSGGKTYDNITLALDARTKEVIATPKFAIHNNN